MVPIDRLGLDAAPSSGEPEELLPARAFLDGGAVPGALSARVADALLEVLVLRADGDRIGALAAQRGDKDLAKKARRAIHRLRTRGVAVEVPRPAAMPARAIEPVEELPSLYIAGDQSEESIVFYVELAAEGVQIFEAAVSEVRGITRFENYGMPRRRWREAISDLENDSRLCAARVPGAFARWVLEEGYLCAVAAGRPVPRAFQQVRHTLAPAVVPARHPVLDLVSDDAVAAAGPTERVLAQVLGLPGVAAWRPDEDWLERAEAKLQEIVYSPLNVDERMKEQRVRECLQAQAAEALANGWRARLERRFLDAGYLILRRGGKHPAAAACDAALCVAAARYMTDPAVPPDDNRLAYGIFARLLRAPTPSQEAPEAPGGSGLILP